MDRRFFLRASAALALAAPSVSARAQGVGALEKKDIALGVGGKSVLYYLPLTIAERLGYFKEQGLSVEIADLAGGGKVLQSLMGGSTEVGVSSYDTTIRMQAKGQDVRAVIELGRFPGIALGIKKTKAASVKTAADLKGLKIGVSGPGSLTHYFVNYLMAKAGGNPKDAIIIGVGTGQAAVAAIEKGELDAMCNAEPILSKLEADGEIDIFADARTEAGTQAIFGHSVPAAAVYFKNAFIEANPNTVQALVNAFYKSLRWIEQASPETIAETVPKEYLLGDRALYLRAVAASKESYSRTGIVPDSGRQSALDLLAQSEPDFAKANIDLAKTFDDRFVKVAQARF